MIKTAIALALLGSAIPAVTQELPTRPALLHGMTMAIELKKTVNAEKARPGDEVEAGTLEPVMLQGRVLIPRGARVTGHVLAVAAYSKDHPESLLRIRFDRASWKQESIDLNAFIVGHLGVKRERHHASDCFPASSKLLAQRAGELPCAVAGPARLDYIFVRNLDDPAGGTQLMSKIKNITLPAGTKLELRHAAP